MCVKKNVEICVIVFKYPFGFSVSAESCIAFFFFFFCFHVCTVHVLFMGPTTTLFRKKKLKMGSTVLFTHLKIILLQCFQFSISATISSIQTNSK